MTYRGSAEERKRGKAEATKACKEIDDVIMAIVRSYLKATRLELGLVVNFAKPTLEIRRVVLSR